MHALRGYLSLELDALHAHLASVFRDLATLARSPDITVRKEVQALMETRIGPMMSVGQGGGRIGEGGGSMEGGAAAMVLL